MDEWIRVPTTSGETLIKYNSICAITQTDEFYDIHLKSGSIFTTTIKNMEDILNNISEIIIT